MADISRGFPDILPPPPTSLPQTSLILKGPSEFQLRDEYMNAELGYNLSKGDTNFINPLMSTYASVGSNVGEYKDLKARQGNDCTRKSPRLCNNRAVISNVDLEDGREVVTISSCQIKSTCDNMISFSLSKTKDIKSLGTSHVNPLRNTGACDIPIAYSSSSDYSKKESVPTPNPSFLTPDSFISPKIKDTEDKSNVIVTPESLLRSTKIKKRSVAEELVSHSPQHQSPQVQNIETVFNQLSLGKSAFSPYGQATKETEFRKKEPNLLTFLTPENFTISDMCIKDNNTNYFSGHIRRYSENEAYLDALNQMQQDLDLDMDQDSLEAEPSGESTKTRNDDGRIHGGGHGKLPPIGVFWDIENCQVPKGLSATHVVQAVRSRFFNGYCEVEFMCVCDTLKENPKILEELNDAQVNVVHVGSTVKNAADDKLLQSMRRFADIHGAGATIVLISGDSNFATELYDLRYRKNLNVVLVHNAQAQDSLKLCAHETALFSDVTQELPQRSMYKPKFNNLRKDITVHNLPECVDEGAIRRRLHKLASNCGGKVLKIKMLTASIMFQTPDLAHRAKRRLDGEDVYGNKIYCTFGRNQNYEKEGSPKFDYPGQRGHHSQVRDQDNDVVIGDSNCSFMMGDLGSANSAWRMRDASASADSFQNPYSAFRNYNRTTPSTSFSESLQGSSNQRNWRASSVWRNQTSANHIGAVYNNFVTAQAGDGGIVHNSDTKEFTSQSLYVDKTTDNFRKGRAQRQFRMNSTSTLCSNKQTDICSFQHSYKALGTSPLLWNGLSTVKSPWNPPVSDTTSQALYSLKDLTIGESNLDSSTASSQVPVELQISNLDQNIEAREMKRILFTIFREHVMVLHVSIFIQSDGNLAATVRIPSLQDAQFAISQLHRRRIGAKRITISYVNHNQPSPELKRSKVIALLQGVPGKRLPLFKFRELYERRYHESIGVSEMYNMRDIVTVSDNMTGRMVSLHPEFRHSNNQLTETAHQEGSGSLMPRFCSVHSLEPDESVGWAERDQTPTVPNVWMPLRILAPNIHLLLQSHSGKLPLASLVDCYRAEIGPIEEIENGVPLEHLVSCLPGVCIACEPGGFKHVQWFENKSVDENEELAKCVSLPLVGQLALFSRELVDLLKTFMSSRLPLSRFIPAYHHHFGRQCRVADYGFTKLADLFEALPHVVQIIGEGNKRQLTLAHKAQVKRFSSDLLRVLKGQPTKSITVDAFPEMYKKILAKEWSVIDYGVCDIEDLLVEVAETTVVINRTNTETTISIPKREQTPEEMERTRQFAVEVVELLRHSPQCKMAFNRFIPAYHHHFGRQCRVADYGFSKLIELFEAVPHVLQVFDEDGEKEIQLVEREKLRVLGDQVSAVVKGSPQQAIQLSALSQVFIKYYGYSLKPQHYGAETLQDLLGKLRNHVKLVETGDEPLVTLVDRGYVHEVMIQARKILWDESTCSMQLKRFSQVYTDVNGRPPNIDVIKKDLEDILIDEEEDEEATIKLVSLQIFARDLLTLLQEAGGRMLLSNFETAYLDRFGVACRPATYGFPNLIALVHSLGDLVSIRGRGTKRILILNKDTAPTPPPPPPPPPQTESPSQFVNEDNGVTSEKLSPSTFNLPELPPATVDVQQNLQNQDILTGNQPLMEQNHTLPYQPHSPIVYSSSSTPGAGSLIWGQVWSPQYPIMSPLSPAHYMVPALSMSWGSLPTPPVLPTLNTSFQNSPPGTQSSLPHPLSIDTLDQLVAPPQVRTDVDPPSASELPTPQFLDHVSMISQPVSVVIEDNVQIYHNVSRTKPVVETEEDAWSGCNAEKDHLEESLNSGQPGGKPLIKRRLAAQFHAN